MIHSMTGFARHEHRAEWGTLTWELRAVNHRYLEVFFRLPEEFRVLENRLRKEVSGRVRRGKLECGLRYQPSELVSAAIQVNARLVDELVAASKNIAATITAELGAAAPPDPVRLLRWPGVVIEPERDLEPLHEQAVAALIAALAELTEMRAAEGQRTGEALEQRAAGLSQLVEAVRQRLPEVRDHIRERMYKRLEQLTLEPDAERFEQELALLLSKMDVDEELDRLDSHISETRAALGRNEPVGRRLDFLMQEFNREANTLASKSQDAETTRIAVEMKVLIEQMREQVQNVE